ncbi:MAG: histidine phosphatase family protein [Thermomicrobiales bacterium]|nr:histidine phosphatase family protein [Thermomicrobiales bacterium]
MKTLLLLRHGKAQSDAPEGDHARELTKRGRRQAAAMGRYIGQEVGIPDAIITSDATRAEMTAEIAAEAMGYVGDLTLVPYMYDAEEHTLLAVVRSILDSVDFALLVGHNPGFEEVAATLADLDDDDVLLPTASYAHITFDVDTWDKARQGTGAWQGIVTPKDLPAADE